MKQILNEISNILMNYTNDVSESDLKVYIYLISQVDGMLMSLINTLIEKSIISNKEYGKIVDSSSIYSEILINEFNKQIENSKKINNVKRR